MVNFDTENYNIKLMICLTFFTRSSMTNRMIPANKFLIIMGNSGSGKNFLAKKLIEEYPQYFEETIQVTTRAKRNDYDPYIFVTKDQYKKLEHQLIGRTIIKTSDGEENWYGTLFPADSEKYKIIILNKAGLEDFKLIMEKHNEIWESKPIVACNIGLINHDIAKIRQMDGQGSRDDQFIQDEIDGIKELCPAYMDVTTEYAKLESVLTHVKNADHYMASANIIDPLFTKETTNE